MKRSGGWLLAAPFMAAFGLLMCLLVLGGSGGSAGYVGGCEAATPTASSGEPPLVQYYLNAAKQYGLGSKGYAFLAAINWRETDFGTDMATSSTGASGWMAFEPATWAEYAVSVTDPKAKADPTDPQDAIFTAANYLHASGAPKAWSTAIFAYNHADWYVSEVEAQAQRYEGATGLTDLQNDIDQAWGNSTQPQWDTPVTATSSNAAPAVTTPTTVEVDQTTTVDQSQGTETFDSSADDCPGAVSNTTAPVDVQPVPGKTAVIMADGLARPGDDAPQAVQAMIAAGDRIDSQAYSYGGAHCVAAMNQTTPDPDACPGDEENGGPGFDCSSTVSYVLWGGGFASEIGNSPEASGELAEEGDPGAGQWVTWYANAGHTFILIDGIVLDTVHGYSVQPASPATGPRWQPAGEVSYEFKYDGYFTARHPDGL